MRRADGPRSSDAICRSSGMSCATAVHIYTQVNTRNGGAMVVLNRRNPYMAGGFTMIELMIAVVVGAILLAIALPSFQPTIRSNRLASTTNQLTSAFTLARSEAIRNTRGGGVCGSTNGSNCANVTDWSGGWLVWSDTNDTGAFEAGTDTVLRYLQGAPHMVVEGPASPDAIRFDRRGRLIGAADVQFSLQPEECGSQDLRRALVVSRVGQVRKVDPLGSCI